MKIAIIVLLGALLAHAEGARVELTFHVDREKAKEIDSDDKAQKAAEDDVPVILKRLQAADIEGAQVAQMKWQIRVTLEGADADTIERVKRIIAYVGRIQFYVASADHGKATDEVAGTRVFFGRAVIKELEAPWIRVNEEPHVDSIHVASVETSDWEYGVIAHFKLDKEGQKTIEQMIPDLLLERKLVIVLDGEAVSFPGASNPVPSIEPCWHVSKIDWSESGTRDMAAILGSGPLPAPLKLVDEKK